jgi:hypothetical protein
MKRRLLGFAAACALLVPASMLAQTTGTLVGKVTDNKGEPLTRATVKVTGGPGAYTKADGTYILTGIKAGSIEVVVKYAGMKDSKEEIRVFIDQTTTYNVKMAPTGGVIVTVTDKREKKAEQVGGVTTTSGKDIEASARTANIFQTVALAGGVSQGGLGIRGGRPNETSIRIDGTEISDPFSGGTGGAGTGLYPTISTLAVDQVQVISSGFGAEYGDVLSGVVNSVTKSGRKDRYEGIFRFRTGVPALYGSASPITVKKAGTNVDTTLPAANYTNSGSKTYEFGFGGPIPGVDMITFFLSGKLTHTPFNGGYEVFDMSQEFADSRAKIADEAWGLHLTPTNLARTPHALSMVRNVQGKFKFDLTDQIALELGGEIGLLSAESGGWDKIYLFDHSTVNPSVLERDGIQWNQNTIINRAQLKYRQFIDNASFFEVTASYLRQITERGKKDETKSYGIFDVFDIYGFEDINSDVVIDRYASPELQIVHNDQDPTRYSGYARNPLTGFYEGGEVAGASRNPYGLVDLSFPVHGNERVLEAREANELRLKGNYETFLDLAKDLQTQIKAGFEIGQTTLRRHENNLPWDAVPFFDVYGYETNYFNGDATGRLRNFFAQPYKPLDGSLYLSTRFAYNSIFFTTGVRFDFMNPNTNIPPLRRDSYEQIIHDIDSLGSSTVKFQVSPRVGVSYPVTEVSQFRVNFAVMFKMPEYNLMYDNAYGEASRGNQLFGNPNIKPQKAVVYELGYSTEVVKGYNIDVSAYYRDIYNQTGVTFVPQIPAGYLIYTVTEYGNVRGLIFGLDARLNNNISAQINYTLQQAVGTASSPGGNYATAIGGVDIYTGNAQKQPLVEYPLSYDQTHNVNASLNLAWGEDDGPSIAGTKLLQNTSISVTAVYATGVPYTLEDTRGRATTEFNSQRLPSGFSTEAHLERGFKLKDLLGDAVGNLEISFYADVYNLLNFTGPSTYRLSRTSGDARFSIAGSPDTDGSGFERQQGDFISTFYYKDIDPLRSETWDQTQYDDFGTRRYNPYADLNLDGVVTQSERYEGYQRYIATIQTLRGTYYAPRTVSMGVKLRF